MPVACTTFALDNMFRWMRGEFVCAKRGMLVEKSPSFPAGQESGRVGRGVGVVVDDDSDAKTIHVYWREEGDHTVWTRASEAGMDVIVYVQKPLAN